jgi:hypothetical protein
MYRYLNPNPHCFIGITKAAAIGCKDPPPVHCTALGGQECASSGAFLDLPRELHLKYHQKHIENYIFLENLLNEKGGCDILRGIFDS